MGHYVWPHFWTCHKKAKQTCLLAHNCFKTYWYTLPTIDTIYYNGVIIIFILKLNTESDQVH